MKKISRRGFTLIELLIVIVIIGILAAAFLPTITSGPKKARDATRKANLQSMVQAIENYALDNKGTYPTVLSAIASYFGGGSVPKDPDGKTDYVYFVPTKDTTNKNSCYILSATMEIAANGNNNAAPTDADAVCTSAFTPPTDPAKTFYILRQRTQ